MFGHPSNQMAVAQGGLATAPAGCRLWHHPYGAGLTGMQNASYRITEASVEISKEGQKPDSVWQSQSPSDSP
jgi:hypothetical protein